MALIEVYRHMLQNLDSIKIATSPLILTKTNKMKTKTKLILAIICTIITTMLLCLFVDKKVYFWTGYLITLPFGLLATTLYSSVFREIKKNDN